MAKIRITGTPEMKKGGWLKGAVNPEHKGFCTPITKSTCTPRRKAFAMTMKKHHGFHKKQEGGPIDPYVLPAFKTGGWTTVKMNSKATNTGMPNYNPHVYFRNNNWYNGLGPHDDLNVTSTMSPIDRDIANLEAEKGELIVKPGLTGLYHIGGKKHSQGGTPLYAEGGSFIFSNDPKLSIKKHEKLAFNFKKGGSDAMSKNTPAKVLSREVNPREYNRYLSIIQSDKSDDISKKTAALMLEKMQNKIGQVAYLQEQKKNAQIPDFAMGSAPVKRPEFQDIKEIEGQYKYGGYYDGGGSYDINGIYIGDKDKYPGGKTPKGRTTPKGLSNNFNYPGGVNKLISDWKGVGVDLTNLDAKQSQSSMYDWAMENNPELVYNMWTKYGNTKKGIKENQVDVPSFYDRPALEGLKSAYVDGLLGARTFSPDRRSPQGSNPNVKPIPNNIGFTGPQAPTNGPSTTISQPTNTAPTLPYDIKGKLTSAQLANLGYLGLNAMNINSYYPKREQVNLPDVRLDKVSAQPYLNQINNQANAAYNVLSNNPSAANANVSNVYGRSIDQTNQTLGAVHNQNIQIGNQENLTNLGQRTNQVITNNQLDSRYYDQLQTTKQNADNERRFARNQFVSTLNNYQSQDDQLAWGLASVNKYGRRPIYDKNGNIAAYKPTPLYEATSNGIKYNSDVADLNMATGADRVNSTAEIKKIMSDFGLSSNDPKQIYAFARLFDAVSGKGKQPVYQNNPYIQ